MREQNKKILIGIGLGFLCLLLIVLAILLTGPTLGWAGAGTGQGWTDLISCCRPHDLGRREG